MKRNRVLGTALALMVALTGVFSLACGDSGIDKTKTQLYVGNYNGGYGGEWLHTLVAEFEAEYATQSFQPGKTGVQVILEENKDLIGKTLRTKMSSSINEVFFTEAVYYYAYLDDNLLLDIGDLVRAENPDDGNKTIESKMSEEQKSFLNVDGAYYAIPHYAGFTGIVYDVDLFDSKGLYYSGVAGKEGQFVASKTEARSKGPDGKTGIIDGKDYSADDGLPATYDEFFKLCDYMYQKRGVTPFVWTGSHRNTYLNWLLAALQTDHEGLQTKLNFDFSGTATGLVTVDAQENVTPRGDVLIDNEHGYEMFSQEGRYYALKFLERMVSDTKYYYYDSFTKTFSNRNAQSAFLLNGIEDTSQNRIAMLPEGIWWEEEAKDDFAYAAKNIDEKYGRDQRRFGYMPLPKATSAKAGQAQTLYDLNKSYAFVNARIEESKVDLAEKFLAFCYTDRALRLFTTTTNTPKAMNYELLPEEYAGLNHFGKTVWDTYRNSETVYASSKNPLYRNNESSLELILTYQTQTEASAVDAFQRSVNRLNAGQFFNGIIERNSQTAWNSAYSAYFD